MVRDERHLLPLAAIVSDLKRISVMKREDKNQSNELSADGSRGKLSASHEDTGEGENLRIPDKLMRLHSQHWA